MSTARTIRQAARHWRISPSRLRKAIAVGELPAYRPGKRWTWLWDSDIEIWLKSHRVTPRSAAEKTLVERRVREILDAERARP